MDEQLIPAPHLFEWPPLLETIKSIFPGKPIYLVGGAVRDAFLRRTVHDLDFVVDDDGRRYAKMVADKLGGAYYPLDADRQVGRAIVESEGERFVVDIARQRGESLTDDLTARDFTMNAIAVPLSTDLQHLLDPLNGLGDLAQKRLRRCSPESIANDPLRALRAIRQSVAFNLMIEPETKKDLHRYGPYITDVSVERIRDEFMTILGGSRPHVALRTLDILGLLKFIIPEVDVMRGVTQSLPHVFDVLNHSFSVVEKMDGVLTTISPARTDETAAEAGYGMIVYLLDRFRHPLQDHIELPLPNGRTTRALLILAALLHDCGKPATRSVDNSGRIHFYEHEIVGADLAENRAIELRLSNDETSRLKAIVRHHMRPIHLNMAPKVTRRSIYRFWNGTEGAGLDICILTLADFLGMVGTELVLPDWIHHVEVVQTLLDGYFNQRESLVEPPTLVTGHDLMKQLNLKAGPEIGRLLRKIGEAQASGEVSTAEQAIEFARSSLDNQPEDDE